MSNELPSGMMPNMVGGVVVLPPSFDDDASYLTISGARDRFSSLRAWARSSIRLNARRSGVSRLGEMGAAERRVELLVPPVTFDSRDVGQDIVKFWHCGG